VLDVKKIRLILELRESGISDSKILSAIEKIPREKFIPENFRNQAYDNLALPIGDNQTISQPFVVAKMTQLLAVESTHKVLEIGTGSGYQSAVLSKLVRRVYTIERIKNLLVKAENIFQELNISNIVPKYADGNFGWKEQIPFDRIIITAATSSISKEVASQIHEGGIIVSPMVRKNKQIIVRYTKINNVLKSDIFDDVLFVPNLSGTQ
jgi:protein-L-isoaspartate(D-aspartate) O-methyltransferase